MTRKHRVAKIFYPFLDYTGFLDFYGIIRHSVDSLCWILMFHHISARLLDLPLSNVPPEKFEKIMRYLLTKGFKIISLSQLAEHLENRGEPPRKSVVITFDDGLKNNYLYAYPILRKYDLPATIFLTTGLIESKIEITSFSKTWNDIFSKFPEEGSPLSWEEIREMSENGIEFGAHTVTHPRLTRIPLGKAKEEIEQSKKEIEDKIGKEVKHFAYPYGDFNEALIEIVRETGFLSAVTGALSPVTKEANLYAMGRLDCAIASNFHYFKALLSGFVPDLKGVWKRFSKKEEII